MFFFFNQNDPTFAEPRLKILQVLGHGDTAQCYLALDRTDNTEKVVKYITCNELWNQICRHNKVLTQLDHENIVHTYEISDIDGKWCIIQEYVEGHNLKQFMETFPLTLEVICNISKGILSALSYLERMGLSHRDIKPSNIIYNPETGKVKLVDIDYISLSHSKTDNFYGTILYAAPEYLFSNAPSACGDCFSFGITLSHLIVGDVPFYLNFNSRIGSITQVTSRILNSNTNLLPYIAQKLSMLVARLVEYINYDRIDIDDAYNLIEEIEQFAKINHQLGVVIRPAQTVLHNYQESIRFLIPTVDETVIDVPVLTHMMRKSLSAFNPYHLEDILSHTLPPESSDNHTPDTQIANTDKAVETKASTNFDEECTRIINQSKITFGLWVSSLIFMFVVAAVGIYLLFCEKYTSAIGTLVTDLFVTGFSSLFLLYQKDITKQQQELFSHLKNMHILEQGEKQINSITDEDMRNRTAADIIKTLANFATSLSANETQSSAPTTPSHFTTGN